MFSFAVKHLSDTSGTGFTASRAVGSADIVGTGMKPVLKKYGIRTSYTVDEANGSEPYEVETVFPNGTYSALDYTPVREGYRFAGWSHGDQLPYDSELEWLATNGGSCPVNTGVYATQDTGYYIKFSFENGSRSGRLGTDVTINGKRYGFWLVNSGGWVAPNGTSYRNPANGTTNKYGTYGGVNCTWEYGLDTVNSRYYGVTESGASVSDSFTFPANDYPSEWTLTSPIYLFACSNGFNVNSHFKLYFCRIYEGGVLIRDFIPVRVGSSAFLYDRANPTGGPNGNGMYGTTGSGKFVAGPGKPAVETIDPSNSVPFRSRAVQAVWQDPVDITFDATTNGGEMPSGWTPPSYYEGQPYGILPVPSKSGSVFLGWFNGGFPISESSRVSYPVVPLVARYAVPTYDTSFQVTTTSAYRKTGIFAATSRNLDNPTIVDWGDGTTDILYENISQLVHTYASNGTFTVRVNNNISSFALSANNSTWYGTTTNNRYVVKKVTAIGSNVTSIPTYAFYYCSAMTDAILPTTISSVPNYCFYYCSALNGITIPSNYTSIGSYAFYRCGSSSFTSVTIPAAITTINTYAFNYCNYLHPVFEASTSTLTLGNYAFSQCGSQGSSFVIDMSMRKVTSIPNYCFQYCRYLSGFVWPQGVTSVGQYAFQYCFYYSGSTGTMTVPEGVTTIGNYSFANCRYLLGITLPSTLSNMNNNSLRGSGTTTITVNRSTAPTVGNTTFGGGTNDYTGRNSYSAGTNRLYVPAGATGYTSSYWGSVLLDSTKCGFTLEEMQ